MHLTDNLTKAISEKTKGLSEDSIREVIDFIEFLKTKEKVKKGLAESILKHVGVWKFEKGELENILKDIQNLREIEG
ncbi:MAG: hypothetical protein AB1478_04015 [Nitrospirota bacterium]